MIPLVLVTGFLGSGKTTLLRRIIRRSAERRLVYLVNDFGAIDVDTRRLAEAGDRVVSIPGGSIFCRCLVTEFIGALQRIAEPPEGGWPPEGVVIEASGMANPRVMGDLLRETRLDCVFAIKKIISLVDPGTLRKLLHTLPNLRAQLEASDLVLINKADCYGAGELEAAERAVREIQPTARLVRTVYAEAEFPLWEDGESAAAAGHGELAGCRDPNFVSITVELDGALEPEALRAALESCRAPIYRAKGFVRTPGGVCDIDYTPTGFSAVPAPSAEPSALVVIGGAGSEAALTPWADALRAQAKAD